VEAPLSILPYPILGLGAGEGRDGSAAVHMFELVVEVTRRMSIVLLLVVWIAVVFSADLLFFRGRFWERLIGNIGIALVFAALYFRLLKNR
jgi:hypothetical protein